MKVRHVVLNSSSRSWRTVGIGPDSTSGFLGLQLDRCQLPAPRGALRVPPREAAADKLHAEVELLGLALIVLASTAGGTAESAKPKAPGQENDKKRHPTGSSRRG
jgi:hypothetical protein